MVMFSEQEDAKQYNINNTKPKWQHSSVTLAMLAPFSWRIASYGLLLK